MKRITCLNQELISLPGYTVVVINTGGGLAPSC